MCVPGASLIRARHPNMKRLRKQKNKEEEEEEEKEKEKGHILRI